MGINRLPTVHVNDVSKLVKKIYENKPDNQ